MKASPSWCRAVNLLDNFQFLHHYISTHVIYLCICLSVDMAPAFLQPDFCICFKFSLRRDVCPRRSRPWPCLILDGMLDRAFIATHARACTSFNFPAFHMFEETYCKEDDVMYLRRFVRGTNSKSMLSTQPNPCPVGKTVESCLQTPFKFCTADLNTDRLQPPRLLRVDFL